MKKILCIIISFLLLLSVTGCARHYRSFRFAYGRVDFIDGGLTRFHASETNNDPSAEAGIPDAPEKRTVTVGGKEHELTLSANSICSYGYAAADYSDKNLHVSYYSGTDKIWEIRQTGTYARAAVLTQWVNMTDENSVIDSAKYILAQLRGTETRYDDFVITTERFNENSGYDEPVKGFIKLANGQKTRYELTFNLKVMDEIYASLKLWFNEMGQIMGYSAPDTSKAEKAWHGITWDKEALEEQLISLTEQTLKEYAERDGHEEALAFCSEKHEYSRTSFDYALKTDKNGKAYFLALTLLKDRDRILSGVATVWFEFRLSNRTHS